MSRRNYGTPPVERACEVCGAGFRAWPNQVRRGRARFCSRRCAGISSGLAFGQMCAEQARLKVSAPFVLDGAQVCQVRLSTGAMALIDAEDADCVRAFNWQECRGYAQTTRWVERKTVLFKMHRLILAVPAGQSIDHINGDGLDNRRRNLRLVTQAQNMQNLRGARSDSRTGVRGVAFKNGRYLPYIKLNGKTVWLGRFETIEEAAAVVRAARARHYTHSEKDRVAG